MGIEISLADVPDDVKATVAGGALDPDQVWYEYLTQDDDRVRPSHRALHGTIWRAGDPNAPVPPTDFGCRCFLRYVAAPGTPAARVLPEAEGPLSTRAEAYGSWLDDRAEGWREAAESVAQVPVGERLSAMVLAIQKRMPDLALSIVREYAMMAIEAAKKAKE